MDAAASDGGLEVEGVVAWVQQHQGRARCIAELKRLQIRYSRWTGRRRRWPRTARAGRRNRGRQIVEGGGVADGEVGGRVGGQVPPRWRPWRSALGPRRPVVSHISAPAAGRGRWRRGYGLRRRREGKRWRRLVRPRAGRRSISKHEESQQGRREDVVSTRIAEIPPCRR